MGRTRESDAQFQMLVVPNKSSGCWPIGFMRGSRVACRISMNIVHYFIGALLHGRAACRPYKEGWGGEKPAQSHRAYVRQQANPLIDGASTCSSPCAPIVRLARVGQGIEAFRRVPPHSLQSPIRSYLVVSPLSPCPSTKIHEEFPTIFCIKASDAHLQQAIPPKKVDEEGKMRQDAFSAFSGGSITPPILPSRPVPIHLQMRKVTISCTTEKDPMRRWASRSGSRAKAGLVQEWYVSPSP